MCSAMMLHASFADTSAAQYIRSSRLIVSPAFMCAVELSSVRSKRQFFEAVTLSSRETSPASMASAARSRVIILVMLAGSLLV